MATKKKQKKAAEKRYVIVRCTQAGVHAGYLERNSGGKVVLSGARRIWYWNGAASLSEIAVYGLNPAKAAQSKIAAKVPEIELRGSDVCEILLCCEAGKASLLGAPEWRA